MPAGLQVWDESGNLVLDTNTRMGRVLGIAQTGAANGSVSNADLAAGTPFAAQIRDSDTVYTTDAPLTLSITGTTVSWTYDPAWPSESRKNIYICYGTY